MDNNQNATRTEILNTNIDSLKVEGPVSGAKIRRLSINSYLKNFRQPKKQKEALAEISDSPDGMVYIIHNEEEIIGYVSFHDPDPYTRWNKHPKILELGAIEISSEYRNNKLGVKLLKFAFSEPIMEDKIIITTEFCWHWDLENTGLSIWSYQKMLAKLFGSVGLKKTDTDEPEIREHAANVLMVKYGKNINDTEKKEFEKLLFMNKK